MSKLLFFLPVVLWVIFIQSAGVAQILTDTPTDTRSPTTYPLWTSIPSNTLIATSIYTLTLTPMLTPTLTLTSTDTPTTTSTPTETPIPTPTRINTPVADFYRTIHINPFLSQRKIIFNVGQLLNEGISHRHGIVLPNQLEPRDTEWSVHEYLGWDYQSSIYNITIPEETEVGTEFEFGWEFLTGSDQTLYVEVKGIIQQEPPLEELRRITFEEIWTMFTLHPLVLGYGNGRGYALESLEILSDSPVEYDYHYPFAHYDECNPSCPEFYGPTAACFDRDESTLEIYFQETGQQELLVSISYYDNLIERVVIAVDVERTSRPTLVPMKTSTPTTTPIPTPTLWLTPTPTNVSGPNGIGVLPYNQYFPVISR